MTTLDLLASHADAVIAEAAAAQTAAQQAAGRRRPAAAAAQAGLAQLQAQQAEVQKQLAGYQADFARLSAADQAQVTDRRRRPGVDRAAPQPAAATAAAGDAVRTALAQVGDRYGVRRQPARTPSTAPGLTMYAYAAAGITLPHSSRAQSRLGTPVSRAELQPGDLVFFYTPISHVGIYIGNGMMVHARTYGSAGRRHQRGPARLPLRRPPSADRLRSVEAAALGEHLHAGGDPLGPGRRRRRRCAPATARRTGWRRPARRTPRWAAGSAASAAARSSGTVIVAEPGVGALPAAVGPGRLHRGEPGRTHPAGGDQRLDRVDVLLRPHAPRPTRGDPLQVNASSSRLAAAVDPAEAEQRLHHLGLGHRRDAGALLREPHVQPGRGRCSASSHASKSGLVGEAQHRKVGRQRHAAILRGAGVVQPTVSGGRPRGYRRRRTAASAAATEGSAWATGHRARRSLWLVRHGESMGNVADAQAQRRRAGRLELDVRDPDVAAVRHRPGPGRGARASGWPSCPTTSGRPPCSARRSPGPRRTAQLAAEHARHAASAPTSGCASATSAPSTG